MANAEHHARCASCYRTLAADELAHGSKERAEAYAAQARQHDEQLRAAQGAKHG